MITLKNISIRQGDFELSGVNLTVAAGEYGVLMGRSGCGKTTILEAICGLRAIESGSVRLGDEEVSGLPPAERGV
ncbi:MAG: ATP-binding cassette domain-containing protein, partial [Verrucomicrobiota bacterium]|nr:ATP-binding cassette domain-containing protein [Verrucomicrobiota bacterium]